MKKIAVFRTDRLGDCILSLPVFTYLRSCLPSCRIAAVTGPGTAEVFMNNPDIEKVIVVDKRGAHRGIAGSLEFVRQMRKEKFDAALILNPSVRSHVLAFISGIRVRVGYAGKLYFLLTHVLADTKDLGLKHESEYCLDIAGLLVHVARGEVESVAGQWDSKAGKAGCIPRITVSKAAREKVSAYLAANGIGANDGFITVCPWASAASKQWEPGKVIQLCDGIAADLGLKTVLVSDKPREEETRKLQASCRHKPAVFCAGISELSALLERSRCLVASDGGVCHLGAAVGCRVVALFGRKSPGLSATRWKPLGDDVHVLQKDPGCDSCSPDHCDRDHECMKLIFVDDVIECIKNGGENEFEGKDCACA